MATLPVARGANGQPPRPPTDASSTVAPASTAAQAQATPVWRVSWKWPPTGTPRIETRSTSRATGRGVATPIVSARTTSPAPAATSRSARSATTPGSTSPSNGQPNEQLIVAVDGRSATARIRSTRAAASSSEAFPFRWLNDSVAASVTLTRPRPVAASRSQPRSLRTSPESSASTSPTAATTSSAPAICGTRSGLTKLTASIRGSPVAASRRTSSARTSGASVSGSFWSPSRGPTSHSVTRTPRGYSYWSASSGFRPAARRAGVIAASSPAITATTDEHDQLADRQLEAKVVLAERARHERRQEDPERQPERRPDQRRDHALVPDHPPRLPSRHPDRAQHPQLPRPLEDGQRERVHHPEEADDHRQGEQDVEQEQELLDLLILLVDPLRARLDACVREALERALDGRFRRRRALRGIEEREAVARALVELVECGLGDARGPSSG